MSADTGEKIFTRKIISISVLIILYIFTGIFAQDRIFNPFQSSTYFENIEFMVATSAALIFGGLIGAVVGGMGYFVLEIILRIMGLKTTPIGVYELTFALALFIGNWIAGMLAHSRKKSYSKFRSLLFDPRIWYNLFINTFAAIVGVGIVTNLIRGFIGSSSSFQDKIIFFLTRFYFSVQLIIIFIPAILLLYYFLDIIRQKRAKMLDRLYHDLDTEIQEDGPAKIISAEFQDHALQVGRWTPIDVTFQHTWKAARSYDIETVSTSKIYPHRDTTTVLQQNETWTHTFYVQPLEQDHVDIRIRIHPAHTIKYKETPTQQTLLAITGKTYIQRDLLFIGVVVFSEVVITLFLFSLLWNQIASIIMQEVFGSRVPTSELSSVHIPWNLILVIGMIEAVLFIPFLIIMYKIQKPNVPNHFEEVLAFSQDIQTHRYEPSRTNSIVGKVRQYFAYPLINIILVTLSILTTVQLFQISQNYVQTNTLDEPTVLLIGLMFVTLFLWVTTLFLLNNTSEFISWDDNITVQTGKYITKVETLSQMKIYTPSEILIEVKNVSDTPGIRIAFESSDAISPPVIELHIGVGETAYFKTSITPQARGQQEILAVIYPLFDQELKYMPIEECKPVASQNISYKVLGQTIVGITENQARTLRHIFGWGSLLTSTMALANEYVGIEEAIRQWQETVPFLATIQIPFLYLYYLFSNKFLTKIKAY